MLGLNVMRNSSGSRRPKKRLGCGTGSGRGRTCGRGHKGQYARSGHKHKLGFEGGQMRLLRRIPKRGFNNQYHKQVFDLVQVGQLSVFESDAEVTPKIMRATGLVRQRGSNSVVPVKVLGTGDIKQKLTVHAHAFSRAAEEKITAAGGVCKVLPKVSSDNA